LATGEAFLSERVGRGIILNMPSLRTYNIFISHSWSYDADYVRLVNLLRLAPLFNWKNYSVSRDDPLAGGSDRKLAVEIDKQIRLASVVLVVSGIYVTYREWIQFEIDLADKYDKPTIGIQPLGSVNTPAAIVRSAVEIVNWNTMSIVAAVRRNAL
jgi:hypothetical protein